MFHFQSKLQIFQIMQVCRNKRLSFNQPFCIFHKIHVVLGIFIQNCRKLGPTSCFGLYILKFTLFRLRCKWPFGISATVSYNSDRHQNIWLRRLGIMTPDVCQLGFSFYFNFSLCPSWPWLRHPTPQK